MLSWENGQFLHEPALLRHSVWVIDQTLDQHILFQTIQKGKKSQEGNPAYLLSENGLAPNLYFEK